MADFERVSFFLPRTLAIANVILSKNSFNPSIEKSNNGTATDHVTSRYIGQIAIGLFLNGSPQNKVDKSDLFFYTPHCAH